MKLEEKLLKKYPQLDNKSVKVVVKKFKAASKEQQKGKGFIDKLVNKTVSAYNAVRNKKQDPRDHVLKDGEKHALFLNKRGALSRAQFAGPGTDVVGNLKKLLKENNDNISLALDDRNFISDADKVALAHDIRYSLETDPDKVREADKKFVNKLKENMKKGLRPKVIFNNFPAYAGVRGKMLAEDAGLIKKGSLAGEIENLSKDDEETLNNTLKHLEMQGYGKLSDFVKKNKAAFYGVSAAVLAGLAVAATGAKQEPKAEFPKFEVGGIKINSRAGFEAYKDLIDKQRFREREKMAEEFFKKTSQGKLKGKGDNPKDRPIRQKKKRQGNMKWINHVKDYAREHGVSYGEALKGARASYKK